MTIKGLSNLIEKHCKREKGSLKPYKPTIKEMVLQRLFDAEAHSKNVDQDEEEEAVDAVKEKKGKNKRIVKQKRIVDSESEEEEELQISSSVRVEQLSEQPSSSSSSEEEKEQKKIKKRKKPMSNSAIESTGLKKLKEMARAAGLSNPAFHKKLHQLNSNSEKEKRARGILQAAGYTLEGKYPTKTEIAHAKAKKDREKELDGIDTSAILPSRRRKRSSTPVVAMHMLYSDASEEVCQFYKHTRFICVIYFIL